MQGGVDAVNTHTYEITFEGQAGPVLTAAFADCHLTTTPDATTVHTPPADQRDLMRLIKRITGLGLRVTGVRLLERQ